MEPPIGAKQIAALLDRHATALELYASQWTPTADDCVQEAFIELARQVEMPEHAVAWLYRVVRNRALNAARASQRRDRHERMAAQLSAARTARAAGDDDTAELAAALETLPQELREVVVLRTWSELTWQQIGRLTDTSSSTAQRRYVEALKQMRKQWESSCSENLRCRPT